MNGTPFHYLLAALGGGLQGYGQQQRDRQQRNDLQERETYQRKRQEVNDARVERNDALDRSLKQADLDLRSRPPKPRKVFSERLGGMVNEDDETFTPIQGVTPRTDPPPRIDPNSLEGIRAAVTKAKALQGVAPPRENTVAAARAASREDRLQQNFQGEPAIKQAGLLANAVAQLNASAAQKTPQGDLNMLYGAVKLRDPNAVREGELALNNKARSAHTQLFSFFDRVRQGRILTDGERQQVMDLVGETVAQQSKLVAPVQARFGKMAREIGADSSYIAPDPFDGVRSPRQAGPSGNPGGLRAQYDAAEAHLKAQGKTSSQIIQTIGARPL